MGSIAAAVEDLVERRVGLFGASTIALGAPHRWVASRDSSGYSERSLSPIKCCLLLLGPLEEGLDDLLPFLEPAKAFPPKGRKEIIKRVRTKLMLIGPSEVEDEGEEEILVSPCTSGYMRS